jgi:AraC-like DNA-binding protein
MNLRCKRLLLLMGCFFFAHFFAQAQLTIRVNKVPENTPTDATLYLVGNFNDWIPGQEKYKMTKNADGTFSYTFAEEKDSLVYKITRSNSWTTVEGRSNGRARPNRITVIKDKASQTVYTTVASWEDLEGHSLSGYILILLLAAIQGFVLILAINRLQDNNRKANRLLSLLLLLVSFALIGRVVVNYRTIFQAYPHIYLLADIVLFTYAPLFYLYLKELLTIQVKRKYPVWLHFIPFLLHTCIYTYMVTIPSQTFIYRMMDNDLTLLFAGTGFIALCYNLLYWFRTLQVLRTYKENARQTHSFDQSLSYLNTVFIVQGLCVMAWIFVFVYIGFGWLLNYDYMEITEYGIDAVWLLFSAITYCLGYFAMNQPAIFKLSPISGVYQTSVLSVAENLLAAADTKDLQATLSQNPDYQIINSEQQAEQAPTNEDTSEQQPIATQETAWLAENTTENKSEIECQPEIIREQISNYQTTNEIVNEIANQLETEHIGTENNNSQALGEKQFDFEPYKSKIEIFLKKEKSYLNPQLTLPELAMQLHISMHMLSRVINECYDKNFQDFINTYRVEEFKALITNPKYKHQTILAVALDAGFNSKTAFNRSFKKITGNTPREFLKKQSLDTIKDE